MNIFLIIGKRLLLVIEHKIVITNIYNVALVFSCENHPNDRVQNVCTLHLTMFKG